MGLQYTENISVFANDGVNVTQATAGVVTQNSTTGAIGASKRQLKSLQVIASGISSGNGVFSAQISNDGTNWVTYNRMLRNNNLGNSSTMVGALTVSASGNDFLFFPQDDTFEYIRFILVRTTDGSYSANLQMAG